MMSLTETYTRLTKDLREFNQEIRRKLSSMPLYTEREMRDLEKWLVEAELMAKDLKTAFSAICPHLKLLRKEYNKLQKEDSSKE